MSGEPDYEALQTEPFPLDPYQEMFRHASETAAKLRQIPRDQEIRARALECAVRLAASQDPPKGDDAVDKFYAVAKQFEDYIRNGK